MVFENVVHLKIVVNKYKEALIPQSFRRNIEPLSSQNKKKCREQICDVPSYKCHEQNYMQKVHYKTFRCLISFINILNFM